MPEVAKSTVRLLERLGVQVDGRLIAGELPPGDAQRSHDDEPAPAADSVRRTVRGAFGQ